MTIVKITHEFDYYTERSEIRHVLDAGEYYNLLWDLDQSIRGKIKHGDDKWLEDEGVCDYLDSLRQVIHESGIFRDE